MLISGDLTYFHRRRKRIQWDECRSQGTDFNAKQQNLRNLTLNSAHHQNGCGKEQHEQPTMSESS